MKVATKITLAAFAGIGAILGVVFLTRKAIENVDGNSEAFRPDGGGGAGGDGDRLPDSRSGIGGDGPQRQLNGTDAPTAQEIPVNTAEFLRPEKAVIPPPAIVPEPASEPEPKTDGETTAA